MRVAVAVVTSAIALAACSSGGASDAPNPSSRPGTTRATTSAPLPAGTLRAYPGWPTYHGNALRTGVSTSMPRFTGTLKIANKVDLDGNVLGSPIVVGGKIIVATENDSVYAFTAGGTKLWKRRLGHPAQQNELPCGNIFPLGITGTPVYANGLVYVAPEYDKPVRHQLVALRVSSGAVAWRRNLDLPGVGASAMQERGALTVTGGRVWVPFGGLAGDCGPYKGRVIGYLANGRGAPAYYTVPTAREAGIWAPPGPTVDRYGWLYVAVGNGASGPGDRYDHSDSVLKLSGRARLAGSFSPTTWATDNAQDLDLGSQGPAVVANKWIFIAGKSGTGYVLRRTALGGVGGQVSKATVCRSFGGTAVLGSTVYVPCTDGVRAVRIGASGKLTVLWHSPVTGSPVIGGNRVWSVDAGSGQLHALSLRTGASTASIAVGAVGHFPTPAIYGPLLIVPTLAGFTIVRTS